MPLCLVLSTFPDQEAAARIATVIVEARLAACVNLLPAVQSIYRWQGKVETAGEVLAMMKTNTEVYPRLEAKLKELHPYEVPEILSIPVEQGLDAYVKWVGDMTVCE